MKTQAINTGIKVAQGTLGAIHFLAQSVADLALEGEAKLINKVQGTDKEEVRLQRMETTIRRQQAVLDRINSSRAFVMRAEQAQASAEE